MLIPFEPWHLDMMQLADPVRATLGKYPSAEILTRLAAVGLVQTIVADEGDEIRVLGVAGAVPVKDGMTAEVLVVAAEERRHHRVEFAKAVRRTLDLARRRFARIEALGEDARWFEWLGFRREGARWVMEGKT